MALGLGEEGRGEERVGVNHQHGVVVVEARQHLGHHLVEGAGLLVLVVDRGDDPGSCSFGRRRRAVAAVVGAHDDVVGRRVLLVQVPDRLADHRFLVVGRDQRHHTGRAPRLGCFKMSARHVLPAVRCLDPHRNGEWQETTMSVTTITRRGGLDPGPRYGP
jgi:hypothetical protein